MSDVCHFYVTFMSLSAVALHRRHHFGALLRAARRGPSGDAADADSHTMPEPRHTLGFCAGYDDGTPSAEYGRVAAQENLRDRLCRHPAGGLHEESQNQAPAGYSQRHAADDEDGNIPERELRDAQESDDRCG